jgi:hypothetical protein
VTARSDRGRVVASVLRGSWRPSPPVPDVDEPGLRAAVPHLLDSGTAPLAWRTIRGTNLGATEGGQSLHHAHAASAIESVRRAALVAQAGAALQAAGIPALLGKGWAAAGAYPHPGLRPFGDIDLYVAPGDVDAARGALPKGPPVDLHAGAAALSDRSWPDVVSRSVPRAAGGIEVRAFGAEDHLRLLALHLLGHGAWRPLWLLDLAAALDARPAGFDWSLFLAGDARRTEWATCALRLAEDLLGASLEDAPREVRERAVPRWLGRAVLRQWGTAGYVPHGCRVPLRDEMARPWRMVRALGQRWPNPVEATVGVGGAFDARPRLPYQLAECAARTLRFVRG